MIHSFALRILLGLALVLGTIGGAYWKGRSDANAKWETRVAEMEAASQKKLLEATHAVRRVETEAAQRLHDVSVQYAREVKDAKLEKDRVLAGLRSGGIRLSVPTASSCRYPEAINPSFTRGDRHEARAELATEAAATLVSIAADGDEAIRQLNACIDAYNEVRAKFNEKSE